MTFRARLVVAATTAVVIAVVLASVAAYVVAHNSLTGSIDDTLVQQAQAGVTSRLQTGCTATTGQCEQYVAPDGTTELGRQPVLPVTSSVRAAAAAAALGKNPTYYFTTLTVNDVHAREIVYPFSNAVEYQTYEGEIIGVTGGAVQLTAPLTGVDHELRNLLIDLWIIAAVGVTLAILLGFLVGRTALVPLNSLTESVEELAETTDVSQRLEAGGVDELGRLRRAFNRLLAALDSSRDAQRQLVLDASHELRTPLTSLKTNMEVARRLDELDVDERQVLINDVLTQLDELTSLVGDLSELARGDQPAPTGGTVRLDMVVADAVSMAITHGRSRAVTFSTALEPNWASGSRGRIERAVGNLLDNALKWSPDGGVVEVACARGTVIVRDHGPGIDDADLEHIFDRLIEPPLLEVGRGRVWVWPSWPKWRGKKEGRWWPAMLREVALFRLTLVEVPPDEGVDEEG